jgi:hypothetical protein
MPKFGPERLNKGTQFARLEILGVASYKSEAWSARKIPFAIRFPFLVDVLLLLGSFWAQTREQQPRPARGVGIPGCCGCCTALGFFLRDPCGDTSALKGNSKHGRSW